MEEDFFSHYLRYTANNEAPTFFHRWSAIAGLSAYLGRNYNIKFGHQILQPNMYCMLLGSPGTRKSTAIKIMKNTVVSAGYTNIAANKTTKEKFLLDLSGQEEVTKKGKDILDENIWGDASDSLIPREVFIAADEFNDFFGNGNIEFISLLGNLWDFEGVFENRIKNGTSVRIPNPTVSILGGNTPVGFSLAFPPEILGQGFFSRILLIYGEVTGKKIAFPVPPTEEETTHILRLLLNIRRNAVGTVELEPTAEKLLTRIYNTWKGIDDVRFESYSNRRFTHLLKLCLIHSAARQTQDEVGNDSKSKTINQQDVIRANTVLTRAEHLMPLALGEFGKSKHSDVTHKIMTMLNKTDVPLTIQVIHERVIRDVTNFGELQIIMQGLVIAQKVQTISGKNGGYLPKKQVIIEESSDVLDYDYLTDEEREMGK